jgi:uncharacterized protein YraI
MQFVFSFSTFRRLWLIVLLALLIAGMVFGLDVAAQGEESPQLTVIAEALNVRAGPGVNYPAIDVLLRGDQVPVTGHHTPSGWWQVQLEDGRDGWVSGGAAYVQVSGDTESVPEVATAAASTAAAPSGQPSTIVFQTVSGLGGVWARRPRQSVGHQRRWHR